QKLSPWYSPPSWSMFARKYRRLHYCIILKIHYKNQSSNFFDCISSNSIRAPFLLNTRLPSPKVRLSSEISPVTAHVIYGLYFLKTILSESVNISISSFVSISSIRRSSIGITTRPSHPLFSQSLLISLKQPP